MIIHSNYFCAVGTTSLMCDTDLEEKSKIDGDWIKSLDHIELRISVATARSLRLQLDLGWPQILKKVSTSYSHRFSF